MMSKRAFKIAGILLLSILLIACGGGFIYYRSLMNTPQYSLALIVDAAKRDDKATINELIDIDAVVDDFMPQIFKKAVELYGRGMPDAVVQKIATLAEPIMPAVKDRAKAQLAHVIRDRTEQFGDVPFFTMVLGADRYLDVEISGDTAMVKSKTSRPFELKMRKNGERWKIVGIRDEQLATDIARSIGQQIIEMATKGVTDEVADRLGVGKLAELLRQAGELVR
jgi:hypothetical protein